MRLWPRSLVVRMACAFGMAVAGVVALSFLVEQFEAAPKPTKRASGGALADGGRLLAYSSAQQPMAGGEPPARDHYSVARQLRPVAGTILLAHREAALAPDIAPVVQILASGELILLRPEPLPEGPLQAAARSRDGHGAGLVLPAQDLAKLSPVARGALLALLRQWLVQRPLTPAMLQSSDVFLAAPAVRRLLSWVP